MISTSTAIRTAVSSLGILLSVHPSGPGIIPLRGQTGPENPAGEAQEGSAPVWSVASTPEVSIGAEDGPDPYILFNVVDAAILSDGTIVVVSYSRNHFDLRFYDPDGEFLTSAGRFGQGPFEVSSAISTLGRLPGDSLMVVSLDRRFSVFGPKGDFGRSGRLDLPPGMFPSHLLSDSHMILWSSRMGKAGGPNQPTPGEFLLSIVELDSGATETLGPFPSGRTLLGERGLFLHLPFEPEIHWAAGGGQCWLGNSGENEVRAFLPDGSSSLTIDLKRPAVSIDREARERWKEFDLTGTKGDRRRAFQAHHRRVRFPETFPVFHDLHVDTDGNLWVLRFEPPWSTADYFWDVFDSRGANVASVVAEFSVLGPEMRSRSYHDLGPIKEIGADYIIVQRRSDLGVITIRKHRLERAAEAGSH